MWYAEDERSLLILMDRAKLDIGCNSLRSETTITRCSQCITQTSSHRHFRAQMIMIKHHLTCTVFQTENRSLSHIIIDTIQTTIVLSQYTSMQQLKSCYASSFHANFIHISISSPTWQLYSYSSCTSRQTAFQISSSYCILFSIIFLLFTFFTNE